MLYHIHQSSPSSLEGGLGSRLDTMKSAMPLPYMAYSARIYAFTFVFRLDGKKFSVVVRLRKVVIVS